MLVLNPGINARQERYVYIPEANSPRPVHPAATARTPTVHLNGHNFSESRTSSYRRRRWLPHPCTIATCYSIQPILPCFIGTIGDFSDRNVVQFPRPLPSSSPLRQNLQSEQRLGMNAYGPPASETYTIDSQRPVNVLIRLNINITQLREIGSNL